MTTGAGELVRRLAENAETVCRRYLSNGRREGCYWLVGDARNTPGRSLYVRLSGGPEGRGAAGKWTDAQSGDHGDLLDLIASACGHHRLGETLAEARRFLSLPDTSLPLRGPQRNLPAGPAVPTPSSERARRLWAASRPLSDDPVATYLRERGLRSVASGAAVRHHPNCFYRPSDLDHAATDRAWPAMVAAVTDLGGRVTGVQRTWLARDGLGKAPVATPRRAMGMLLGNGIRFGEAGAVMAAGEGIETMLSLREILPTMPMIAALSAAHLAALLFPPVLRRLYVACDADAAGHSALRRLAERGAQAAIEVIALHPCLDDFNSDLIRLGAPSLAAALAGQLRSEDAGYFLSQAA
ncbi:toprim domain-containing protein [Novosphingobium sp. CECT 9465]|uniref:DUF7146 domain-containing protein n=1 Tax=Novosphingobium sp. CECT 9465 TaxID=2829794 RepID=UPI001E4E6E2C|nr:toprim domain-containing protein [Novosphingobium sp. CECT 9465]CAH0496417.1 hypothetical protein NVSP9465_01451 [Novosphingobium sp. CECT 9465]